MEFKWAVPLTSSVFMNQTWDCIASEQVLTPLSHLKIKLKIIFQVAQRDEHLLRVGSPKFDS